MEDYAKYFLEISSEQRLKIIQLLNEKEYKLSELAKKLDATTPEVHRNLERLEKMGFLIKNSNAHFVLTALLYNFQRHLLQILRLDFRQYVNHQRTY